MTSFIASRYDLFVFSTIDHDSLHSLRAAHCVEDQFDAGGDAKLVEDMKQVVLDRMFAEIELVGDLAILQAIAQETHDIFLSFGQQFHSVGIYDAHGRKSAEC